MLIFWCNSCSLRCEAYYEWLNHLLAVDHQKKVAEEFDSWSDPLNDRSLIITGLKRLSNAGNTEMGFVVTDVIQYFLPRAIISDCYIQPELDFLVLQLDSKDVVTDLLTAEHCIDGRPIHLSRKSEIFVVDKPVSKNDTKVEKETESRMESFSIKNTSFPLKRGKIVPDIHTLRKPTDDLLPVKSNFARVSVCVQIPVGSRVYFQETMKDVAEDDILKENLKRLWTICIEEFNSRVWTRCFGLKYKVLGNLEADTCRLHKRTSKILKCSSDKQEFIKVMREKLQRISNSKGYCDIKFRCQPEKCKVNVPQCDEGATLGKRHMRADRILKQMFQLLVKDSRIQSVPILHPLSKLLTGLSCELKIEDISCEWSDVGKAEYRFKGEIRNLDMKQFDALLRNLVERYSAEQIRKWIDTGFTKNLLNSIRKGT